MKAVLLNRTSEVRVVDVPQPTVGDRDVLIRVGASGICASDLHLAAIKTSDLPYPLLPGHEVAGTVTCTGPTVTRVRLGEKIVVQPTVACGVCRLCRLGQPNLCPDAQIIGLHRPGGWAEYLVLPEPNAFGSGELPLSIAACTEPLACALHGIRRLAPRPADHVLIFGAGTIGLFFLQLVHQHCAGPITVVDQYPERLVTARQLGADHLLLADCVVEESLAEQQPDGFDCVVDATGVPGVIETAFRWLRPAGKLLLLGSPPAVAAIAIHPRRLQRNDVTVVGAYSFAHEFSAALGLLKAGRIQAEPIVTDQYPLEAFPDAWQQAWSGRRSIKVQIVPG
jgi:D-arabinitol dehydrogenase (NADP+)